MHLSLQAACIVIDNQLFEWRFASSAGQELRKNCAPASQKLPTPNAVRTVHRPEIGLHLG